MGGQDAVKWSDAHLVFQADGVLHSLPWDLLPFGDQRRSLVQSVGGISQIVSLSMRTALENCSTVESPANEPPRILSVYHLSDAEWDHAKGFRSLHSQIFNHLVPDGWKVDGLANADHLKASVKNIQALLNSKDRNYRLAAIGGHGSGTDYGISMLNKQLFTGTGIDFRQLDGLIAISCSLGQMESVYASQIDGFYVSLACHGLKRLLAARWPVPDALASQFGYEVIVQWAEFSSANSKGGIYERAVHSVRQQWLSDYFNDPKKNAGKRFVAMAFSHFGCR